MFETMESKKHGFSDQILSPRRKVVSRFGLGVMASVIVLTVMLLNCTLKAPIIHPMLQGFGNNTFNSSLRSWPFSFANPSTVDNSSKIEETGDLNGRFERGKVSKNGKIEDLFVKNGEVVVLRNTNLVGNFSETASNGSIGVEEAGMPQIVTEKTRLGNSSEISKNGSFNGEQFMNKLPQRNSSQEINSSKVLPKENVTKLNANSVGGSSDLSKNTTDEKIRTSEKIAKGSFTDCDIFDGNWVRDDSKPYYPAGSCPYIDRDFDCYLNGRPDDGFLKWKWQPNGCDIPSLNGTDFLERLRGKKLVFVGDSLNRNMWESLVCILRHGIKDKKKVHEISGRREFKKKGFYAFRFEDYNCTVDFVSAPFLVRESSHKGKNGTIETLRLDLMDQTTSMYYDADIVVFNTGHWWTHEKTSRGEDYYQEGNTVYSRLKVLEAYKRALTTWARWVDKNIDGKRTQVFFRGYSVTHFRGGQWNSGGQCNKEVEPIFNQTYLAKYPSKMRALQYVLEDMKNHVTYLNISRLTDYRKDGHPSIYRTEYKTTQERVSAEHSQDCSHWCLPGVPDTWNELLYASLLKLGKGSWGS